MNEDTLAIAGDRQAVLVPAIVAAVLLACVALGVLGLSLTRSRTVVAALNGPVQLLNGGFALEADGWASVGPGSIRWVPEHGGSLALGSSSNAAPVGAVAAAGPLIIGNLADGAVYRLSAKVRLVQPGVRNVRLAILDCVGGAAPGLASRDFRPRLRTDAWTTVSMETRLRRAACTAPLPGVQITGVGNGDLLRVDDVSLTRL